MPGCAKHWLACIHLPTPLHVPANFPDSLCVFVCVLPAPLLTKGPVPVLWPRVRLRPPLSMIRRSMRILRSLSGRGSPVYPLIISPNGQISPAPPPPPMEGNTEHLDVAFDAQLYHLEHAVIQVEQCSVLAALQSLLADKDRQIGYWEQKYATAADALKVQADNLSSMREIQEGDRTKAQTIAQQLASAQKALEDHLHDYQVCCTLHAVACMPTVTCPKAQKLPLPEASRKTILKYGKMGENG